MCKMIYLIEAVFLLFIVISNGSSAYLNQTKTAIRYRPTTLTEYYALRQEIVDQQYASSFESDVEIDEFEKQADAIIMMEKTKEIQKGLVHPSTYIPSRHIFEVRERIARSKLFRIIKRMPKGGVLHSHDTAMCSTDCLIRFTRRSDLWQCNHTTDGIVRFKFSRDKPSSEEENLSRNCTWTTVAEARAAIGKRKYDRNLRTLFSLYTEDPHTTYQDINVVWSKFRQIFSLVRSIVTYAPVWKDYYKMALREHLADGVQYLEFRSILPDLYDLDGNNFTTSEIVNIYMKALDEFKQENPDFIGSKLIYAPSRQTTNESIAIYMENILEMNERFPEFFAGFDFVGQEDLGRRLIDFVPYVLTLPSNIRGYFHAGETNWFGETDENLIDAILLGGKRIGHGYALAKYPNLMKIVKERDIAVEVNPISNQVLKLVDDYRNHPAAIFFAENMPLVISSDDFSYWETTPLSHDFYQAFLGIASSHSGLKTLKKLATNSIKYSSMNDQEKSIAYDKWQRKWYMFIEDIITDSI